MGIYIYMGMAYQYANMRDVCIYIWMWLRHLSIMSTFNAYFNQIISHECASQLLYLYNFSPPIINSVEIHSCYICYLATPPFNYGPLIKFVPFSTPQLTCVCVCVCNFMLYLSPQKIIFQSSIYMITCHLIFKIFSQFLFTIL